jgi:translation initiation factor 1A
MPRGVKTARSVNKAPKREMVFRENGQDYAIVTKILGNSRMMVKFQDSTEKQCTVRGSMRKREWVNMNDIVLVAFRDFGDQHDIIRRYTEDEAAYLKKIGEWNVAVATDDTQDPEDVDIVFEDVDDI